MPAHLVMHVLLSYDRVHGTDLFHGITISDVVNHEADVDEILSRFALPDAVLGDVRTWYLEHVRDPEAVAASHRPYQGVLGVIRWFQLQASHARGSQHRQGGVDAETHARLAQRARLPSIGSCSIPSCCS